MRRTTTLKVLILLVVFALAGIFSVRSVFAATGQIYVSPGTTNVQNQSNFSVGVRINPGTAVDSVTMNLSWDSSKVKFVSIDTSQSAFSLTLTQSVSASSLSTDRGTLTSGGVTSDSLIATVNFQALTGSGSAALTLSGVNAYLGGVATNPSPVSGAVNFTTPPPTPTPTPPPASGGGSSSGSSGGSKTTTPTPATPASPAADATPPKVENFDTAKGKLQFNTATISLSTDEPTQVYVKYGLDGKLDQQTTLSELSKTHAISLDGEALLPGATYSYEVVAKDAAGNTTTSPVKTFKTKGYTLHVTVLGSDNLPLKNAEVVLHSDPLTAKTDDHGVAVFNDVAPGNHHVNYQSGSKQYSQAVAVDDNVVTDKATGAQTAAVQNVAVQFAIKGSKSTPLLAIVVVVVVLVLIAGAVWWYMSGKSFGKHQPPSFSNYDGGQPTAPIAPSTPQAPSALGMVMQPAAQPDISHVQGISNPNPGSVVTPQANGERLF